MLVVDTNIFLHAVRKESSNHQKALSLLKGWQTGLTPWHATWSIFYEFLRVSTHRAVFRRPLSSQQAWDFLKALLDSPNFSILEHTNNHFLVTQGLIKIFPHLSGNLWHDAHIIALMKEHGIIEIVTADTDFHRFSEMKVTNPF